MIKRILVASAQEMEGVVNVLGHSSLSYPFKISV